MSDLRRAVQRCQEDGISVRLWVDPRSDSLHVVAVRSRRRSPDGRRRAVFSPPLAGGNDHEQLIWYVEEARRRLLREAEQAAS